MPPAVDGAGDVAGQDRLVQRRGGQGQGVQGQAEAHGPGVRRPRAAAGHPRPGQLRPGLRVRHPGVGAARLAAGRARDDPDRQALGDPHPHGRRQDIPELGGRVSSMTMPSPALGSQPPEEAAATRRSTELLMTAFALALVALAFASTAFTLKGQHPSTIIGYIVAYSVIIIGAHLALRKFAPFATPLLLPIATALNGLGLVMIYRLTEVGRSGNPGPNTHSGVIPASSATVTQLIYTVIGIAVFVLFLWRIKDIKVLQPYTYILGLGGLVLIALPALLPASISGVGGTSAKIQIAIGGFSVQPEEFGKLLLAASFASYLMEHGQQLSLLTDKWLFFRMPRRKDLAPILVVWALSMLLLIFESDIGTSAVFMGLFVAMLYIATGRRSWVVIGFGMFIAGAFLAATIVSHVGQRFTVWLHPFSPANLEQG